MSDDTNDDIYTMPTVNLWAVHSSKDERPVLRGWARTEAAANELVSKMRSEDAESEDEYWVEQMTEHDCGVYKAMGIIPADVNV